MNDFISNEKKTESSNIANNNGLVVEDKALADDDAEITPDNKKKIYRGMLFVLIGGASWGAFGTAAKYLLDTYHVDPMWLIVIRELCACWLFLGTAFVFDRKNLTTVIKSPKELAKIFVVSLFAILFSQVAYIYAVNATNSGTATIMQSLGMLGVLAFVCIVGRRWPRRREILGIVLALLGTYLLVTGGNPGKLNLPTSGIFWGVMCAFAQASLSILPKPLMEKWGSFTVNGLAFLFSGTLIAVFYQPWNHMPQLDAFGILLVVIGVLVGTFLAFGLYLQGVKDAGSLRAVLLGTIEPVMATITTVLVLGTTFSIAELIGFALILAMVVLTA